MFMPKNDLYFLVIFEEDLVLYQIIFLLIKFRLKEKKSSFRKIFNWIICCTLICFCLWIFCVHLTNKTIAHLKLFQQEYYRWTLEKWSELDFQLWDVVSRENFFSIFLFWENISNWKKDLIKTNPITNMNDLFLLDEVHHKSHSVF